jgi:hypothetical protein
MTPNAVYLSGEHKRLLGQLRELIPDFDSEVPENLQRIFGLGLFALLIQVTINPNDMGKSELRRELVAAAKEMVGEMDV